jgi:hypothetical protein
MTLQASWHCKHHDIASIMTLQASWHCKHHDIARIMTLQASWHCKHHDIASIMTLQASCYACHLQHMLVYAYCNIPCCNTYVLATKTGLHHAHTYLWRQHAKLHLRALVSEYIYAYIHIYTYTYIYMTLRVVSVVAVWKRGKRLSFPASSRYCAADSTTTVTHWWLDIACAHCSCQKLQLCGIRCATRGFEHAGGLEELWCRCCRPIISVM